MPLGKACGSLIGVLGRPLTISYVMWAVGALDETQSKSDAPRKSSRLSEKVLGHTLATYPMVWEVGAHQCGIMVSVVQELTQSAERFRGYLADIADNLRRRVASSCRFRCLFL